MIKAAIFDMDGLLIDSEFIWTAAAREVMQNINFELTHALRLQTTGLSTKLFLEFCYQIQPWNTPSLEELEADITKLAHKRILQEVLPMPGAIQIVKDLHNKGLKLAVASASHMELIEGVLKKINIIEYFDTWHSGQLEEFTKPHPGVYLTAAQKLGVLPHECLAFEDSFTGLRAAHGAGMVSISVPSQETFDNPQFDLADYKISSLDQFDLTTMSQSKVNTNA